MFKDLNLSPVYDSADSDLVTDLIAPLLMESKEYWRGVGYFTSGWIRNACNGIQGLVESNGFARIVTSPMLEKSDWEALVRAEEARRDSVLMGVLKNHVQDLETALASDTLNALAWMVADGLFEFRFAIPHSYGGAEDYHDKVGVFMDAEGDVVAIHGSFNDTAKGSLNGEAFSVFKSWEAGQEIFVELHMRRLKNLWLKGNSQFQIMKLPDAIKQDIVCLRSSSRPYSLPGDVEILKPSVRTSGGKEVHLREYQKSAIAAWKESNCRGIFEMATGTGKTYTALAAAKEKVNEIDRLVVIILVPQLHLVDQWRKNCEDFGFSPVLCSSAHLNWQLELQLQLQDFRLGFLKSISIICVQKTASSKKFIDSLKQVEENSTLLIADEVHHLGSTHLKKALYSFADMRLGLSATPHRWFDERGTKALFEYFDGVCYSFSLEEAIGKFLTSYQYFPILVNFTEEESAEYSAITKVIAKLLAKNKKEKSNSIEERLKQLLLKRAHLISAAKGKIPALIRKFKELLLEQSQNGGELLHVLVYCANGTHKEVLRNIASLGLRCHEFVGTVPSRQRSKLLKQFARGDIQVLVAMHCLDEGVDVPATRTAFFLASTSNPKEFIQRRGRILRKHLNKTSADVYDFLVIPNHEDICMSVKENTGLLVREMPRFAEFASCSLNEFQARERLFEVLKSYKALHLLDEKPWDIYHKAQMTSNGMDWRNDG